MGNFARRDPPLDKVFPSSQAPLQGPTELHDGVQLVHPWPGRAACLIQQTYRGWTSAAALAPQKDTEAVPQGKYWEIILGNLSHNSVAAQTLHLGLADPIAQVLIVTRIEIIGNAVWAALGSHFSTGGYLYPPPLFVPAGWRLRITGDVAAAPYNVTFMAMILEHPLAESPLY